MKKQNLLILILILGAYFNSIAQVKFQKSYSHGITNKAYSFQQTSDNGYVILGTTRTTFGSSNNLYLIKTDSNGDTLWTKSFAATSSNNGSEGHAVQQTNDGGYILMAYHNDTVGIATTDNALLIKTDASGNSLWCKSYGGWYYNSFGQIGQQTNDGGYIMVGGTFFGGAGGNDIYLIKTDNNGDSLWTRTLGKTTSYDVGASVIQTSDGGYIVIGTSLNSGIADIYLIKTDNSGNPSWSKTYGGTSDDYGFTVQQTSDGGFILSCSTSSFGTGLVNPYLIKTNSNGDTLWTKVYSGNSSDEISGYAVNQTNDGGYILTGGATISVGDIAYIIKTDSTGNLTWSKRYGTSDEASFSVTQCNDGGYAMVGSTDMSGNQQIYLVKTDANGNSDCNESNLPLTVNSASTQVSNQTTLSSSQGVAVPQSTIVTSGGTSTTFCTSVGLNEIQLDYTFSLFPNPSSGNFNITLNKNFKDGKIAVINLLGECVFEEHLINQSNKEIQMKNISHGIYFVKVFDGEQSYCKKIIVEQD
ncbi:MAG TPA: T9SS type A sorting domain-containing protein [Bacteroidia bacterium]|nr:T9SS type A sorting domain-containing protein [Bacteroidia bacterium]